MSGPENSSANVYAAMDSLSRERASVINLPDHIRLFSAEIAGDIVTSSDEDIITATMDLDGKASTDDRVTREVIKTAKLGDIYRRSLEHPAATNAGLSDAAEADALDHLREALAARRFRLEYPDRFEVSGDGYYASATFNGGSELTAQLVADFLSMRKQEPGVR